MRIPSSEFVRSREEAIERTLADWRRSNDRLLRIEGFTGAGKTRLAHSLRRATDATLISTDCFAIRTAGGRDRPYIESLDLRSLHSYAATILQTAGPVIVEGVCLNESLPSKQFGRGFVDYVKRASCNTDLWPDDYRDDERAPTSGLHRSIWDYHQFNTPDATADLVLAIKECLP
jgi:hypothetical protein